MTVNGKIINRREHITKKCWKNYKLQIPLYWMMAGEWQQCVCRHLHRELLQQLTKAFNFQFTRCCETTSWITMNCGRSLKELTHILMPTLRCYHFALVKCFCFLIFHSLYACCWSQHSVRCTNAFMFAESYVKKLTWQIKRNARKFMKYFHVQH